MNETTPPVMEQTEAAAGLIENVTVRPDVAVAVGVLKDYQNQRLDQLIEAARR